MTDTAKISEYFCSFQGEGPFLGTKQFFIRFASCNIPHCRFCDTQGLFAAKEISRDDLISIVLEEHQKHQFDEISLTGGEPLLYCDFLTDFLKCLFNIRKFFIYLETNATLTSEILKISSYVGRVSADFKLTSVTGQSSYSDLHVLFLKNMEDLKMDYFIKCVVNEDVDLDEFSSMCSIISANCKKRLLVIQPESSGKDISISYQVLEKLYDIAVQRSIKPRIIPQTHKMLNLR